MSRLRKKPDIVMFYKDGENYLAEFVLQNKNYVVFEPSKKNAVLDPLFYLSSIYFITLCLTGTSSFKNPSKSIKVFFQRIFAFYFSLRVKKFCPKLVLTYIDNSIYFHLTKAFCPNIVFVAVQNGGRHAWCATRYKFNGCIKYNVDHYFCFGRYVRDNFMSHNHSIGSYHVVGSLLSSIFDSQTECSISKQEERYQICLISQWAAHLTDAAAPPKDWPSFPVVSDLLARYIDRYCQEKNASVCVALRTTDIREREYFSRRISVPVVFSSSSNRMDFSSYEAANRSAVVIGMNSTLITEMFSMKKRVMFFNPFGDQWLLTTKNIGLWSLVSADYCDFKERLDVLSVISDQDYLDLALGEINHNCYFNSEGSARYLIESWISKFLKQDTFLATKK